MWSKERDLCLATWRGVWKTLWPADPWVGPEPPLGSEQAGNSPFPQGPWLRPRPSPSVCRLAKSALCPASHQ